jgi:hypothetical protein
MKQAVLGDATPPCCFAMARVEARAKARGNFIKWLEESIDAIPYYVD